MGAIKRVFRVSSRFILKKDNSFGVKYFDSQDTFNISMRLYENILPHVSFKGEDGSKVTVNKDEIAGVRELEMVKQSVVETDQGESKEV